MKVKELLKVLFDDQCVELLLVVPSILLSVSAALFGGKHDCN